MKYELISSKNVGHDEVYEVKCTPGKTAKFFGKKEKNQILIYTGERYNVSGKKAFYDVHGNKLLTDVAYWLNSKLFNDKYTKETQKKEKTTFTTTLIPLNVKNLNGRMYIDNDNLRDAIDTINKRVESIGVVYGEYNYPESFETTLSRSSHTVKNVKIEGDKVVGDITILTTHYGKKLEKDYKNIVFRPRSAGIVDENGLVNIKQLFTFDAIMRDTDAFLDVSKIEKTIDIDG